MLGGRSNVLWTTQDRGAAWHAHAASQLIRIAALGIAGSAVVVHSDAGTARSTDGGASWSPTTSTDLGPEWSSPPLTPDATTVVAWSRDGRILISDDAGRSFRAAPPPQLSSTADAIVGVAAASAQEIVVLGSARPTHRVATFIPMPGGGPGGKTIYASDPGDLAWTRDGGQTWNVLDAPIVGRAIARTDRFTLILGTGELAVSTDMRSWNVLSLPRGVSCTDASAAGAGAWLSCMRPTGTALEGLLLHTGDAGRTWDALHVLGSDVLVAAVSPTDAWTADGATLLRTTDSGRTWTQRWVSVP